MITRSTPRLFLGALCLVACSLLSRLPASSAADVRWEPYHWRNVEIGGGGGFITGIVFSKAQKGLVYARTDIGGVYRRDGKSNRWVPLTDWVGQSDGNLRGAESIAVDPTDARRVYVAAGMYSYRHPDAILRSYDQGRTWHVSEIPVAMGSNEPGRNIGERLNVDPDKPNILYFGSRHDGLWKSMDFGDTWKRVESFPVVPDNQARRGGFGARGGSRPPAQAGVGFVVFDPAGSIKGWPTDTIYVGVASASVPEIYRSTDAGATWRVVPGQPTGMLPQRAALDKDGSLYISYANATGPDDISDGTVWKLDTKTGAWTDITPERETAANPGGYCGLSVDDEHPGTVMVGTMDRWRAEDGWSPTEDIFRSTDSGAHWVELGSKSVRDTAGAPWLSWDNPTVRFGDWIAALAIDPFDSEHVLYGTGATIWESGDLKSADAGAATYWKVGALGIEETSVIVLDSPPSGAHLISGVCDICGFVHHDLDVSPPRGMMNNPTFGNTSSIAFAAHKPAVVVRVAVGGQRIPGGAISMNGGDSWAPFASEPAGSQGGGSIALTADGHSIVWAPVGAQVSYSRDGGATWTQCSGLPHLDANMRGTYDGFGRMTVLADPTDPAKVYAVDPKTTTLFTSNDGGATFTVTNSNLPSGKEDIKAVPGREGDLWLADAEQGLYHSVDYGATFIALPNVPDADGIGFGKAAPHKSYPALFMTGVQEETHGVFRSDDEGATWIRINDDAHQYGWIGEPITGDPRVFGRVYLGTDGRGILYGDTAK